MEFWSAALWTQDSGRPLNIVRRQLVVLCNRVSIVPQYDCPTSPTRNHYSLSLFLISVENGGGLDIRRGFVYMAFQSRCGIESLHKRDVTTST